MNNNILNQAKEICDKEVKEMNKNWNITSFSPAHAYSYMYISVVNALLKKEYEENKNC